MVDVQLTLSESQYGVRVAMEHGRYAHTLGEMYLRLEGNGVLLPAGIYGTLQECAAEGVRDDAWAVLPLVAAAADTMPRPLRLPRNLFGPDGSVRRLLALPNVPDEFRSIEGQQRMAAALLEATRLGWVEFAQAQHARKGVDTMILTAEGHALLGQYANEIASDDGLTDDDREDEYWLSQRVRSGEIDHATYERESMCILGRSSRAYKFIPAFSLSADDGGILKSLGVLPYGF